MVRSELALPLATEADVCAFCRTVPPPAGAQADYTPKEFGRGHEVLKKNSLASVAADVALTTIDAKVTGSDKGALYDVHVTVPPDGSAVTHRRVGAAADGVRCVRACARFLFRFNDALSFVC
jgi:hypothetical protein